MLKSRRGTVSRKLRGRRMEKWPTQIGVLGTHTGFFWENGQPKPGTIPSLTRHHAVEPYFKIVLTLRDKLGFWFHSSQIAQIVHF
jgi:hypothetical protein